MHLSGKAIEIRTGSIPYTIAFLVIMPNKHNSRNYYLQESLSISFDYRGDKPLGMSCSISVIRVAAESPTVFGK